MGIGSIYHHFGDKEGLARNLHVMLASRMHQLIGEIELRTDRCHDQARELVARLVELTEAEPRSMRFKLYARRRGFLPDEPPVCSSRPLVMTHDMVSCGKARGEIGDSDAKVASTCLFGGPLRMITARLDGILPHPLPRYPGRPGLRLAFACQALKSEEQGTCPMPAILDQAIETHCAAFV